MTSLTSAPPARPAIPARERRKISRRRKLLRWVLITLILMLGIPSALISGAGMYLERMDQVLPGVWMGPVSLEGMSLLQAADAIDRHWNQEYRLTAVVTGDPTRTWVIAPQEFGLEVEALESARRAWELGKGQGLIGNIKQALTIWQHGAYFIPSVGLDIDRARAAYIDWGERLYVPPVEATLAIETGEVVQTSGAMGEALDEQASLAALRQDPFGAMMHTGVVPLVMRDVQPKIMDVSPQASEAERLLKAQPRLEAYDPATGEYLSWELDREHLASWVRIQRTAEGYRVSLDQGVLEHHVAMINDQLGESRSLNEAKALQVLRAGIQSPDVPLVDRRLLIRYEPTFYIAEPGDTVASIASKFVTPRWKILEYNPRISSFGLSTGQRITIPPKDANLSLPVVMDKRILISISDQHMWVYKDGEEIRDFVISTGMAGSNTLPGIFQVSAHYINAYGSTWDLWMPHFLTIYQAPYGLENGIHGLPLLSSGVRLWANVLGQPASFGCVILDLESAEWLYGFAEDGVVVEIQR